MRAENAALAWCHFAAGVGIHHAQRELFGGWCCAAQRPILLLAACPLVGGRLLTVVGRIAQKVLARYALRLRFFSSLASTSADARFAYHPRPIVGYPIWIMGAYTSPSPDSYRYGSAQNG